MSSKEKKSRHISHTSERKLLAKQEHKCANVPGSNLYGIEDYECLLWLFPGRNGVFGREGYQIDHIIEHSLTGDNSTENLQLLCPNCHNVKTINYAQNKNSIVKHKIQISPNEILFKKIEVTGNKEDFIPVSEMKDFKERYKKYFGKMSPQKFNKIIGETLEIEQTRKGAEGIRGWRGIKWKSKNLDD